MIIWVQVNMKKKSVTELLSERNAMLAKREQINIRMNEIADAAQAAKRELSAEENVEYQKLQSDFHKVGREIAMNVDMVNMKNAMPKTEKSANQLMREALREAKREGQAEFALKREITTEVIDEGGLIPLTIKDILPPLEMG